MPEPQRFRPPPWYFREYSPVGVELGTPQAVADYDRNQGTSAERDNELLDRLGVTNGTVLVDLACGTGSFVVEAARRGAEAHGVDVSREMLRFAQDRADDEGVPARWHHAGFLDHRHQGPAADVVTTRSALHQLPDMWKQHALRNAAGMLRAGGTFYLWDAMFSFDPADADQELQRWVDAAAGGHGFTPQDFETHIREEFSTYTWILEGLLHRAGLEVVSASFPAPTHGEFVCRKT
jgi:ubiquinone/menaquinone biosynthesis C-methylase UbiE